MLHYALKNMRNNSEDLKNMAYTIDEIKNLAELVSKLKLGKIAVKTKDFELVIEGKKCIAPPPVPAPAPVSMTNVMPAIPAPEKPCEPAAEKISGNVVKSPVVGTYYSAPAPDKEPFVKVGSTVRKGDVIMIIESMKLMNEIQSEFDGTVKEILVKNGDAVEYDQPVMIIE